MIFSSYEFIFQYLPVVLIGYYLLRYYQKYAAVKLFLTAASLLFYGIGQPDYLVSFMFSIGLNYLIIWGLERIRHLWARRGLLALAVLWNIGLLVYFKYTNFLFEVANVLFGTSLGAISVILPVGISFFTFQILSYTIDVYMGKAEVVPLVDYALFVSFFPQLIVGPVVRHNELLPQFDRETLMGFDSTNLCRGVLLFSVGCAKKILLANPLINHAVAFYASDVAAANMVQTWMGVLAYTFAFYFDFSGYIDMARGLGYLFGIKLPINFNSPYQARDFAEFWRRWNMTISRFFHETVFSNLFHFGNRIPRLVYATLMTFLVSGLWHGADWHFLAWGLVNGILVSVANIGTLKRRKLPKTLGVWVTFFLSVMVRVLFDANGMTQAFTIYRRMFAFEGFGSLLSSAAAFVGENPAVVLLMAVDAVICFALPNSNRIDQKTQFRLRDAVFAAVILTVSMFCMSEVSTFLYFNF